MELKQIKFTPDEEGNAYPNRITVEMGIKEAIWIASVAGKCRGESPHNGIYACLINDVINRHWDDGINDARRMYPVDIPDISSTSNAANEPRNEVE